MRMKRENEIVSAWFFEGGNKDARCEMDTVSCLKELRMRRKRDNEIGSA
jgi:hypothetical protein